MTKYLFLKELNIVMVSKVIPLITHIFIWSLLFLLIYFNADRIGLLDRQNPIFLIALLFGLLSNLVVFYGVSDYLTPLVIRSKKYFCYILRIASLYFVVTFLECFGDYLFFVPNSGEILGNKLLIDHFMLNAVVNFFVIFGGCTYGFFKGWFDNELQKQVLVQENLRAELDFLKAQVNPHFLFNILNMAYATAEEVHDERTASIIEQLANLLRYMLYESNVHKVSLYQEVDYIENYVSLQKLRLSNAALSQVSFHHNVTSSDTPQIAPLLLIAFVENAFKHGIRLGSDTFIFINLHLKDTVLYFEVANSIAGNRGVDSVNDGLGGIGLYNVRKRLELLYPNSHSLEITELDQQFTVNLALTLK